MGKRQYECPLTFNLCLDEKSEMAVYMYLYSRGDTIFLQNSMNNILDFRQKLIKSSLLTVSLQSTYFRTVVSIDIRKKSQISKDIIAAYFALVGRTSGNTMSSPKSGRFTYN